jgi:hypothetical protein
MAKTKRTNNDKQNIIHKTKDRVTRTPQKPDMISGAPVGTRCITNRKVFTTSGTYPWSLVKY